MTQRDEVNSRYQGEEISHNKASLKEKVHHNRMQKSYSPNVPDSQSDHETGKTNIDMKKTYTYMNKAEIHHQVGESQITGKYRFVTSIQVEVSDKV